MDRVIFHCDLNAFYASVELLSDPELREKPVAVCGDPAARHGIILAKNEAAKAQGVKTAETIWQARRKCPALLLLPAHHDKYRYYSRLAGEIYRRYTDLVEPFGIDESWLDVTGTLGLFGGDPAALADRLREEMKRELGLTISVGVSFNKVFAKLGSDMKKPDATTVIPIDGWQNIVWPQPLGNLLYAGRAATQTLKKYGVETIGQLAACDPAMPEQLLGKMGRQLWEYANGLDKSPVKPRHAADPVKSVGNGTTFPDALVRWEQICAGLMPLCDSVAARLRRHGLYAGGVSVTLKDVSFKTFSRQTRLDAPTHLVRDIYRAAADLARQLWKPPARLRSMTVTALYVTETCSTFQQLDLLDSTAQACGQRQEQLEEAVDAIRQKYGRTAIAFGNGEEGEVLPEEEL